MTICWGIIVVLALITIVALMSTRSSGRLRIEITDDYREK